MKAMLGGRIWIAVLAGLGLGIVHEAKATASGVFSIEAIALSGDPALGLPTGTTFVRFDGSTYLSSTGVVQFNAVLTGPTIDSSNRNSVWVGGSSSPPSLFAQQNGPVGTTGFTFGFLGAEPAVIDTSSQLLMHTQIGGVPGGNGDALIYGQPGAPGVIAFEGGPTGAGATFVDLQPGEIAYSDAGRLGIAATISTGPGTRRQILLGTANSYAPVLTQGDVVPSSTGPVTAGDLRVVSINDVGQAVINGTYNGTNSDAVYATTTSGVSMVLGDGQPAPGLAGGTVRQISRASINNAGTYVFSSDIGGLPGVGYAVWTGSNGSASVLVKEGDVATGLGPFVMFSDDFTSNTPTAINAHDTVAFQAKIEGLGVTQANDQTLWVSTATGHQLIAREGETLPGISGATVNEIFNFALNGKDEVMFNVRLSDQTQAVYVYQAQSGQHVKVAHDSELFEVAPGDTRVLDLAVGGVIRFDDISGDSDGRYSGFNDRSQLSLYARFTNGTEGVFLVTVPEPTSLAILAMAGGFTARRRRA